MLGVKGYSSVQLRTQTRTDMAKIKVTKAKTSGVAKIVKNIKKIDNTITKKLKNVLKRMHTNTQTQHDEYDTLKQEYEENQTFNDNLWTKHLEKLENTGI